MGEAEDVLRALEAPGRKALVTIVGVRGSAYRREGAKLVVSEGGELAGNISGGCLEGEVAELAREVMERGTPLTRVFDLTADDEAVWGWGLGCNGVIEVFCEPAGTAGAFVSALRAARAERRTLAVATILDGPRAGARLAVHPDGRTEGPAAEAGEAAAEALREGRSRQAVLPSGERVFVEVVRPPLRLVVCGAGHDAIPLVELASRLGWRAEVADDRRAFLTAERFPGAAALHEVEPGRVAEQAGVDAETYTVVMTHNYLRDRDYLRSLLASPAPYIGVLGPRARLERLLDELRREGLEPQGLERVHGPVGLDLGAEGPEEIALAVVAEVMAVSRGRQAGFLRGAEAIHAR